MQHQISILMLKIFVYQHLQQIIIKRNLTIINTSIFIFRLSYSRVLFFFDRCFFLLFLIRKHMCVLFCFVYTLFFFLFLPTILMKIERKKKLFWSLLSHTVEHLRKIFNVFFFSFFKCERSLMIVVVCFVYIY